MGGVMAESILRWYLNGEKQMPLLCSPGEEEALLAGFLLTSQTVKNAASIRAEKDGEGAWRITADADPHPPQDLYERMANISPCASSLRVPMHRIQRLFDSLTALGSGGGRHAALLAVGETVAVGRDIGRHNALDKAVGCAAAAGLPLADAIFCTSGRLNIEIVSKAVSVGIPILCTRKQVGDLALRHAEAWGAAIVQTGERPQVFGAAWRVEGVSSICGS